VANIVEEDGVGSRDGDLDEFSTLRIFEPEAARGLEGNVRWPGPVTELGVPGSNRYGKRRSEPARNRFADDTVNLEHIREPQEYVGDRQAR